LPPEKDIPGLIVQFEALASENGLILESLNFIERTIKKTGEAEEEKKDYKSLAVFLSLTGNYKSFENFLKALELNVRLMDIKSIEFSSEKIEEEGIFNFNVDLEVYCQ